MGDKLLRLFQSAKNDLPEKVFDLGDRIAVINRGFNISRNVSDGKILVFDVSRALYPVLDDGSIDLLLDKGFPRGTAILQRVKTETDLQRVSFNKKNALENNNTSSAKFFDRQRKKMLNKLDNIDKYLQL